MRDNNYQRIADVLLHKGVSSGDRVPFYEHWVDVEVVEAITGAKLSNLDLSDKVEKERYWKAIVDFYYSLGYDYVPIEVAPNFARDNIKVAADTAGPLAHAGGRGWVDENRGMISSWEDFDRYPWPKEDNLLDYSHYEVVAKNLPPEMKIIGNAAGGVFEWLSWLMGLVPLSFAIYDQPELVEAVASKVGEILYKANKNIIELLGDKMCALRMGDDLGFKTGTLLPPEVLRRYIFPWQKKIADLAHEHHLPFILHSCGNLRMIMDDLIEYVGIDAKHSFEDVIMPAGEAKKKYGDRITILGGVDVNKLATYTGEELRSYVRSILEECAVDGIYALGSGNTIANYIPVENYLIMLDEGRKFKC